MESFIYTQDNKTKWDRITMLMVKRFLSNVALVSFMVLILVAIVTAKEWQVASSQMVKAEKTFNPILH